jgi:hypothetical protein
LAWITVNANASGDNGSSFGHGWIVITNDNGTQEVIGHYPSGISSVADMDRIPSAYYTFEVDQSLADKARKAAVSEGLYDFFGRNCVDLVERSLDAAEIYHPSFNKLGISRPDMLYNWIINIDSGPTCP